MAIVKASLAERTAKSKAAAIKIRKLLKKKNISIFEELTKSESCLDKFLSRREMFIGYLLYEVSLSSTTIIKDLGVDSGSFARYKFNIKCRFEEALNSL